MDRGFVDRGDVSGRWPRLGPSGSAAGGPGGDVLLAVDNRDAVTSADYLRYGLRVRSRYVGVLPAEDREEPERSGSARRRRLAVGFRGTTSTIKPPKVLALVPLTASLETDPLKSKPGLPPFMVLLDETFFREYGVGERLEMQLTLENLDLGEDPGVAVPYRTGPLADHWLAPQPRMGDQPYYKQRQVTQANNEATPIELTLFGPFGYSLDLTPSEALANASAFLAYAPEKVEPHWSMFVRLRRKLDKPSGQTEKMVSDWSDAHALYTLPDTRILATRQGLALAVDLGTTTATLSDLRLVLDPPDSRQSRETRRRTARPPVSTAIFCSSAGSSAAPATSSTRSCP